MKEASLWGVTKGRDMIRESTTSTIIRAGMNVTKRTSILSSTRPPTHALEVRPAEPSLGPYPDTAAVAKGEVGVEEGEGEAAGTRTCIKMGNLVIRCKNKRLHLRTVYN